MWQARHSVRQHKDQDLVLPDQYDTGPDRGSSSTSDVEERDEIGLPLEAHAEDSEIHGIGHQCEL